VGRRSESAKGNGSSGKPMIKKNLRTGKSFISEDFGIRGRKRTTMAIWLDVSVIGGKREMSDQPTFSNSNDLKNTWKAVDRERTEAHGRKRWRGVSVEEGSLGLGLCDGGTLERKRRAGLLRWQFSIFASPVKEGDGARAVPWPRKNLRGHAQIRILVVPSRYKADFEPAKI
jgi:hypothetical protein